MSIRLFELDENKKLKLTENVYLVPELKALIDKYKGDNMIPVLYYVYFMTVPDSPYSNLESVEKEAEISADSGGTFTTDDVLIGKAIDKLNKLYETPTARVLTAARINLDKMVEDLTTKEITYGRDGNADHMYRLQMNLAKIMDNFKKLEKMKAEEDKVAMRGKAKVGLY